MNLQIKPEFLNSIITRGTIKLDTSRVLKSHYINFYNNGFKDIFDVTIDMPSSKPIKYKGVIEPSLNNIYPDTKE